MGMSLGDRLRVTLFGESHGTCVGALIEGVPPVHRSTLRP